MSEEDNSPIHAPKGILFIDRSLRRLDEGYWSSREELLFFRARLERHHEKNGGTPLPPRPKAPWESKP